MKIATNKLGDLYKFWQTELGNLYDEDELLAVFELTSEHYLGYNKADVKTNWNSNLNQSEVLKIYDTAKALKLGTPIQYILGETFFYDLKFKVTSATLIPRPETEELVDLIIKQNKTSLNQDLSILDLGTGSGCILVTLKKHLPAAYVKGIDVSDDALEIAKYNAHKNGVEVEFQKMNILETSQLSNLNQQFSIIVSNPPYVLKSEAAQMTEQVLNHEPHLALFVDDNDPIIFYKKIIDLCKINLAALGFLYFELNPIHAADVEAYALDSKLFKTVELIKDMSGKHRFLKAQKL